MIFDVEERLAGKLPLEFLAWAVNHDGRRAGSAITLMPDSLPPMLNRPGQMLQYVLVREPSDRPRDDASALATWLDEIREEFYVDVDAAAHWGDDVEPNDDAATDTPT